MTARELAADPQARLQDALDAAYRHLSRRDRTEREVRRHLEQRRVEPAAIDDALAELKVAGYVDDARYAVRFAEDRRSLDAWGSDRIARRLAALGVASEHIAAALAEQEPEEELEAAVAVLVRRVGAPPADDRERNRALGLLVRRGYDLELAHDAVRRFERGADAA